MTESDHQIEEFRRVMIAAANAAGNELRARCGKLSFIREKSSAGDLVTDADQAAEAAIVSLLEKHHPTHGILGEEGTAKQGSEEYLWVIDPLDGTTNFAHGYPNFVVSIALWKGRTPLLGVVYDPLREELFFAERGKGLSLNGKAITGVSTTDRLSAALLATGFGYDRREVGAETNYAEFCTVTHSSHGVRRSGAAALDLAYVAAGRLDGFWERGLKPWDLAAGILLVQEGRGQVTAYQGAPFDLFGGTVIATNGLLHEELLILLSKAPAYFATLH